MGVLTLHLHNNYVHVHVRTLYYLVGAAALHGNNRRRPVSACTGGHRWKCAGSPGNILRVAHVATSTWMSTCVNSIINVHKIDMCISNQNSNSKTHC